MDPKSQESIVDVKIVGLRLSERVAEDIEAELARQFSVGVYFRPNFGTDTHLFRLDAQKYRRMLPEFSDELGMFLNGLLKKQILRASKLGSGGSDSRMTIEHRVAEHQTPGFEKRVTQLSLGRLVRHRQGTMGKLIAKAAAATIVSFLGAACGTEEGGQYGRDVVSGRIAVDKPKVEIDPLLYELLVEFNADRLALDPDADTSADVELRILKFAPTVGGAQGASDEQKLGLCEIYGLDGLGPEHQWAEVTILATEQWREATGVTMSPEAERLNLRYIVYHELAHALLVRLEHTPKPPGLHPTTPHDILNPEFQPMPSKKIKAAWPRLKTNLFNNTPGKFNSTDTDKDE